MHTGGGHGNLWMHQRAVTAARDLLDTDPLMMGLILQSRALEAAVALAAAAWCGVVVWKTIDYIVTTKRASREDKRHDPDLDA